MSRDEERIAARRAQRAWLVERGLSPDLTEAEIEAVFAEYRRRWIE